MIDIVEFLTARLDEDEQIARAAAGPVPRDRWSTLSWYNGEFENGETARVDVQGRAAGPISSLGALERAHGEHIARHDPAHVLRAIAANRAIVALHRPKLIEGKNADGDDREELFCGSCVELWPCDTAKYSASVYADHPDYDERWRP